jgi:ATP-dependent DNA ligase
MRPSVPRVLPPTPEEFIAQIKYDGWNVVVNKGHVYTRHGQDITSWVDDWHFPLEWEMPLNGELTVIGGERHDIPGLRTGRCRPRVHVFDIMVEDIPLEERLNWIDDNINVKYGGAWAAVHRKFSSWEVANADLQYLKNCGYEGLVLKKLGSRYHVGSEMSVVTPDWLKLKVPAEV